MNPQHNPKLNKLIDALKAYNPDKIFLFGAWARGEADELSDLDLVLIKKTRAPFFNRLMEIRKIIPKDIGGIDILVYTPSEFARMKKQGNAFVEMILEEGRLIYAG